MSQERDGLRESLTQVRYLSAATNPTDLLGWSSGERARQTLLKLTSAEGTAFLDVGHGGALEPSVQKMLMRLTNSGWTVQGQLRVEFDGVLDEESDDGPGKPLEFDLCTLELGRGLLALVDPAQNSPILGAVASLRRDLADEVGFSVPGVRVRDRLELAPTVYRIVLRGSVAAQGEVFLDRFLALGSLEQLSVLRGWSTIEPSYRAPAKWIEPEEREAAEQAGCVLFHGVSVIATHLRETLKVHACDLLGLQETHALVARLSFTHPLVAAPFLETAERLRALRRLLHRLLADRVSIHDLPAIVETAGDCLDFIEDTDEVAEVVRTVLARQLTARCLDQEGVLQAFVLADPVEQALQDEAKARAQQLERGATSPTLRQRARVRPSHRRALAEHWLPALVREGCGLHEGPVVLLTIPEVRLAVQSLLLELGPHLTVLSLDEVASGTRVEILSTLDFPRQVDGLAASSAAVIAEPEPLGANDGAASADTLTEAAPAKPAPRNQPFWKR
jgi:flagellar biosynthesis component FlhA